MLYPLVGAAGTGKTTYMIERIRQLCAEGEKVLLLVPEQFSFEMERRILLEVGRQSVGLVEVKSFSHFCRKVFMEFGGGAGQYITDAAKAMLMHSSLHQLKDKLEQYGKAASRPGFAASALKLIEQFKNAGTKPEDLQKFAELCGEERLKSKCMELHEIYSVYQANLEQGFVDDREDLARAVELLRGKNYFKNHYIFLDSFRDFTPVEREMISVMMESCKGIYLSIMAKNIENKGKKSNNDSNDVFKVVKDNALHIISAAKERLMPVSAPLYFEKAHRYRYEELEWLAQMLTEIRPQPLNGDCDALTVYQAADPYEELRYTAAQISHLIKNEGYHYKDFTIITRDLAKYQTAMEQLFRRYDIPLFWDNRMDIRHVAVVRALLEALDAVQTNFATEHILALAKSPLMGLEHTAVLELENYCYLWSVKKEQWLQPFSGNPQGITARLDDEDKALLERINTTASAVMTPLLHLKEALSDADGLQFAQGVYSFLEEVSARDKLKAAFATEGLLYEEMLQQNNEAWDILMDLLDTMAAILKGQITPMDQLIELFRMGIEASDFGTIPNTLDQVAVGTADRIRPNAPKVVFVLGMNQGEFPPKIQEQPFFTDGERETLLEAGIQLGPTIVRQNDYEQLYLYSALTAASERLYLCYHLSLSDGSECAPSPLIRSILSLTNNRALLTKEQLGELFFAANEATVFDTLCRQYRRDEPMISALYEYIKRADSGEKLEVLESVLSRRGFAMEDEEMASQLFGREMRLSPSNVDKYFSCPFSYYCYAGLRLRARRKADYSSLEAGSLLHHLLAEMITRHGGKGLQDLSMAQLEQESAHLVDAYLADCMGDPDKLKKRSQYLFRTLAHRASYILKQLGDEFAQSEFEPLYCELPIRPYSQVEPVIFESNDGVRLSIEGIVDRVDVMEKNGRRYARVIDYKSGGQSFSFTEMYHGLKLQMLLYLLSICENGKGKLRDAVPGGVLYFPATDAALQTAHSSDGEAVKQQRRKHYKMTGLVLEDEDCIFGMEQPQVKQSKKGEQKQVMGEYIPVKSTANGWHASQSKLATEPQMKLIFKHIRRLMTDMADDLTHGHIDAKPLGTKSQQPCTYCEFKSICQVPNSGRQTVFEAMKTLSKEECFESLAQQYNEEGEE